MKIIGIGLAAVLTIFTVATAGHFFAYGTFWFFAPKYEAVRRDVMIESRYYSEATIRELYRLKRQYSSAATDAERETIRATALHEFEIFPQDRLPPDLRLWFSQLRG